MIEDVAPVPPAQLIRAHWRRWRMPALLVLFILVGGVAVALLRSSPAPAGSLDPRDPGPGGARAVTALLRARGQAVVRADSVAAALAAARGGAATIVVTHPEALGVAGRAALAASRDSLILIAPDEGAVAALAPRVAVAGSAAVRGRAANCALPGARLAGPAWMGGVLLRTDAPGTWRCYPARAASPHGVSGRGGSAGGVTALPRPVSLVRYVSGGRAVTVLGTGAPFTNRALGRDGNAALAMNLLGSARRVVWLMPGSPPAAAGAPGRPRSAVSLIPPAAGLVALELVAAVLLAAVWRARRFGPLVAEPLPVVVRASETVRGHGRLYRARRARGRAASVLREAALSRIAARTGLPAGLPPAAVSRELAGRSGREAAAVQELLFGPAPADDAALVALAAALDTLEGQVLAS